MIREIKITDIKINKEAIVKRMRVRDQEDIDRINELCEQAIDVAVPKTIFAIGYINDSNNEQVTINEITFNSKLMSKNFDKLHRVFPFMATCGREVFDWANKIDDVFERYWADYIMEAILRSAIRELYDVIKNEFGLEKLSSMNPGSLEGWPIEQQEHLFSLFNKGKEPLGISLTDTFLMIPQKSISGILFPSDSNYVNCQLCERVNCQSRRVPFNIEIKKKLTI
ncbi:MAG: vitamin B12 dependent methionine synthase [Clostridiales bacterium]|nr:vitamin B12 dependent methionine synthase [Clostridiales bacterium]